ncbi:MAG TPA: hypothetical protein VM390_03405 [Acidimicrobiales bacterium]|nr:hypothetical protein [Acidimicrobiales bacterium]
MTLRRFLALVAVAALLVPAGVAAAQTVPRDDPPATGGPSGTGGNVPGAGRTGNGVGLPDEGGGGGNGMLVAAIGVGVAVVAVAAIAAAGRRHRRVEAGDPVGFGDDRAQT